MDPVLVLDAAMPVASARAALAMLDDHPVVVVRRRHPTLPGVLLWYRPTADAVAALIATVPDADVPLGRFLGLHEHQALDTRQAGHADVIGDHWEGLVVDGGRPVGWAHATVKVGRGGLDVAPAHTPPAPGGAGSPPPDAADEMATSGAQPGADPVAAYPRLDVPEAVDPGQRFEIVVGLSDGPQPGLAASAGSFAIPQRTTELTVLIKADRFAVEGVRHVLPVDPERLGANEVRVWLTAPTPTELPWFGRIEAEFSLNGLLVGSAWRDLAVSAQSDAASTTGGDTPMQLDQRVPIDLTVSISRGQNDSTFLWTFLTPHNVPLPEEQVITELDRDTAETFALQKVRQIARVDGSGEAELTVLGVAREVAAAMPVWFWKTLAAVWTIAHGAGRVPTVLIVSKESLVPWELAITDEDYILDQQLLDAAAPPILGAQVALGRWRPAGPETPSGVRRPTSSPPETVQVDRLAVVVGEFGPESGMRALAEAIAEGQSLTQAYASVRVKGTASEVASLLKGTLTDRGLPVDAQVLHVASHGEVDPDSPVNSGVILSDSAVRIDQQVVLGSAFARKAAPLVFLNACQQASDAGASLVEGGLAAAFLQAGARAFVAPLWSIDDTLAKQFAVDFYAAALGQGRPVGEVVRELRARYVARPERDQTTPLAYCFYGHPALTLTRRES